jgi:DNA primase
MKNAAESIRYSADIARVIGDYVSLKKAGTNLKGLCPFHGEKTPSFSVHAEKQIFHCFGCGVGGDVFKFVMLIEQVSFPESIKIVAEKCGIPMPAVSEADSRANRERDGLVELYERAAAFFQRRLGTPEAVDARRILGEREIKPEFVERFGIGYAPPYGLLKTLNPSEPKKTGLFSENDRGETYDRFRRRLMFPIWNERGKVIAFGGRIVGDGQPKYLNSPESPLYSKSYVLYGVHLAKNEARKAGKMVVVEGYFDVLSLHQNGIENVVASCGTSLTPQQVGILSRYVPEIVINYDADAAGQKAAKRSIELLLERGLTVRILRLPDGLDPDDFVRREGPEAYRALLDKAPYFWEHLVSEAQRQEDLNRPEVKSKVASEILGYVRCISDRLVQVEITRSVAESFGIPPDIAIEQLRTGREPKASTVGRASATAKKRKLTEAEKQIIHAVLGNADVAQALEQFLVNDFLSDVWSGSVIENLIRNPELDIETAMDGVEEGELTQAVRAAVVESPGFVPLEMAIVSMGRLFEEYLTKEEQQLQEQFRQCQGTAPHELLQRKMEIASQKTRLRQMR